MIIVAVMLLLLAVALAVTIAGSVKYLSEMEEQENEDFFNNQ